MPALEDLLCARCWSFQQRRCEGEAESFEVLCMAIEERNSCTCLGLE